MSLISWANLCIYTYMMLTNQITTNSHIQKKTKYKIGLSVTTFQIHRRGLISGTFSKTKNQARYKHIE